MSVSAIGSSASGASYIQQLRELLFQNSSSTKVTEADLEAAATAQGGSVQQANNLYTALGGNADGSGSLSVSQVVGGLQQLLDGSTQNQVYAAQSAQTPAYSSRIADLFSQADTNGDGVISQQDLANAVTSNGGTTQQADALFAALDTAGNGNLTESEFQSGVQQIVADAQAAVAQQVSPPDSSASLSSLFQQLTGGSGSLTQSELEQAFTSQGGTTAQADALYAQLDPNNTGSVSESQFVSGIQQLMAPPAGGGPGGTAALSGLFDQLTGGSGDLTKSELEQAFTADGATAAQADTLYTELDPNNTGSVSESQFVSGIQQLMAQQQPPAPPAGGPGAGGGESLSTLFGQLTGGSGTLTKNELEQAFTSLGGTTAQADALYAQLDPNDTGSVSESQFVSGMQQVMTQEVSASTTGAADPAGLSALFDQITGGSGSLTKSELEQSFTSAGGTTAQADALYAQLDPNDTGSVSKSQFISGVTDLAVNHGSGQGSSQGSGSTSASSSAQATTTTQVNPDGSVTTTVTYANGSTVTTTTPAPANDAAASNVYAGGVIGPVDAKTINALFSLLAA